MECSQCFLTCWGSTFNEINISAFSTLQKYEKRMEEVHLGKSLVISILMYNIQLLIPNIKNIIVLDRSGLHSKKRLT